MVRVHYSSRNIQKDSDLAMNPDLDLARNPDLEMYPTPYPKLETKSGNASYYDNSSLGRQSPLQDHMVYTMTGNIGIPHVATSESDERQSVVQMSGSNTSMSARTKVKGRPVPPKGALKKQKGQAQTIMEHHKAAGIRLEYLVFCALFLFGMISYMFWILKQDPVPSFSGLGKIATAIGADAAAAVGAAVGATTEAAASVGAAVGATTTTKVAGKNVA